MEDVEGGAIVLNSSDSGSVSSDSAASSQSEGLGDTEGVGISSLGEGESHDSGDQEAVASSDARASDVRSRSSDDNSEVAVDPAGEEADDEADISDRDGHDGDGESCSSGDVELGVENRARAGSLDEQRSEDEHAQIQQEAGGAELASVVRIDSVLGAARSDGDLHKSSAAHPRGPHSREEDGSTVFPAVAQVVASAETDSISAGGPGAPTASARQNQSGQSVALCHPSPVARNQLPAAQLTFARQHPQSHSAMQSQTSRPVLLPSPPPPSPAPVSAMRPPLAPTSQQPLGNFLVRDMLPVIPARFQDQGRYVPESAVVEKACAAVRDMLPGTPAGSQGQARFPTDSAFDVKASGGTPKLIPSTSEPVEGNAQPYLEIDWRGSESTERDPVAILELAELEESRKVKGDEVLSLHSSERARKVVGSDRPLDKQATAIEDVPGAVVEDELQSPMLCAMTALPTPAATIATLCEVKVDTFSVQESEGSSIPVSRRSLLARLNRIEEHTNVWDRPVTSHEPSRLKKKGRARLWSDVEAYDVDAREEGNVVQVHAQAKGAWDVVSLAQQSAKRARHLAREVHAFKEKRPFTQGAAGQSGTLPQTQSPSLLGTENILTTSQCNLPLAQVGLAFVGNSGGELGSGSGKKRRKRM